MVLRGTSLEQSMGHKNQTPQPVNRGGYWCLLRRVPAEFVAVETRKNVKISTGIRVVHDPRGIAAKERVVALDIELRRYWEALASGHNPQEQAITLAATRHAIRASVPLLSFEQASTLTHTELFARLTKVVGGKSAVDFVADGLTTDALGAVHAAIGVPTAHITKAAKTGPKIKDLIIESERINATSLALKSPDQLRKWRRPKQTALEQLLRHVDGDLPIAELTLEHVHPFREHWQERVVAKEVKISSANRMMKHVAGLYAHIHSHHHFKVQNPFLGILFKRGVDDSREAYDTLFIQDRFLADDVFAGLNAEARRLIFLMVETGIRPSEACALDKASINLDGDIPHVSVTTARKDTKTRGSVRQIPLVGVALLAMREQPNGFPGYFDRSNSVTTLIGQALAARDLKPTPKHTLYSLRHSLMDRLRDAGAPENIQKDIAGHKYLYGKGTSLATRHAWLKTIALRPPSTV